MKYTFITFLLFILSPPMASAQRYGQIMCGWDSRNLVTHKVLWEFEDQEEPEIWKEYPQARLIRHICSGGWELPAPGGVIYPVYFVYKNEEPSIYDCGKLSYNFFERNPQMINNAINAGKHRLEYRHPDFIVVIEYKANSQ